MANALRTFMIQEELRVSHAERYLAYLDRYHSQVLLDLRKCLEAGWEKTVAEMDKVHLVNQDAVEDALLKNPKATTKLTLARTPEKIYSSRLREASEVYPSVKIPFTFPREERDLIAKKCLATAKECFQHTVDAWSEVFKYEKRGRSLPSFKIVSDHDGLRLQLAVSQGSDEAYKTLYAVHNEYGKPGSKLRDFDRVYLTSLI